MRKSDRIYLDHNATTPCAPEVVEAMLPFLDLEFANPGSPHAMGRKAAAAVARARQQVAELVACDADQIVFTSGATESNNLALLGCCATATGRRKIVTSAVEHRSVLAPCDHLAAMGLEVITLPVDRAGIVDIEAAESSVDDHTLLVSIQAANNETGTIQDVSAFAHLARAHGALMHSDCAQRLGKVPLAVAALGVDYASFSAHKMYGPKGVGALFLRDANSRDMLSPLLFGGSQEGGLRPGTLNVPAIVGFGAACKLAAETVEEDAVRITRLRDYLERELCSRIPSVIVNGSVESRLPGTSSLTFPGVSAQVLILRADNICVSDGSACQAGDLAPSHALQAMGIADSDATETLRLSLGRDTTYADVSCAVEALETAARDP